MASQTDCGPSASRAFAGWVPTITGQLSFSLIGQGTNSADCVTANVETFDPPTARVPTRHVIVHQKRIARDLSVPGWLAKLVKPWVGVHFVLVGTSGAADRPRLDLPPKRGRYQILGDQIGVLRGKVYVAGHEEKNKNALPNFARDITRRIVKIERSTPRGTICGDFDLKEELSLVPTVAKSVGVTLAECSFEIYRSGEIRLFFDETADVFSSAEDESTTDQSRAPQNLSEGLAKQIYYFIKDISHRHFHHDASSDNMLPAFEVLQGDDDSWRRDSLWSLSRAVLEHRRRNVLIGHKQALGILAYAESFQSHLARVRRLPNGGFEPSEAGMSFDFSHARASLEATIEELAFRKSFSSGIQSVVIATILGSVALWIGAVQIKDVVCSVDDAECVAPVVPPAIAQLLRGSIEYPAVPFALTVVLALLWSASSNRGLQHIPLLRRLRRFIGGWGTALGASTSRMCRRWFPAVGDLVGAAVTWIVSLAAVLLMMRAAAGFFSLLPFPNWLTLETWLAAILSLLRTGHL